MYYLPYQTYGYATNKEFTMEDKNSPKLLERVKQINTFFTLFKGY